MALNPEVLRMTMRQWATGVTIVTTALGEERAGMTVSSFTSVSLEPPTVLVCLQKTTHTHALVAGAGVYAISMLSAGQDALSNRFAGLEPGVTDRFEGLDLAVADTGSPLLPGAVAWLDCVVRSTLDTGTHTIYVADVVYAKVNPELAPLVYHNRGYRVLADTEKAGV